MWLEIQSKSDDFNKISLDLFRKSFGNSLSRLSERQVFVLDKNLAPAGTGTAWFCDNGQYANFGRIHWLAVMPDYQGQGIGKALMTLLCKKLKMLGYKNVYLSTSTLRLKAINLYLKFGFTPEIKNQSDFLMWKDLREKLKASPGPNEKKIDH